MYSSSTFLALFSTPQKIGFDTLKCFLVKEMYQTLICPQYQHHSLWYFWVGVFAEIYRLDWCQICLLKEIELIL